MIRALHRWPGLIALLLVALMGLSGAALSIFPAIEHLTSPQATPSLSVAELASRVQAAYPGVEQIRRAPSGRITAFWFADGAPGAAVIDPATGRGVASADANPAERWLTELHRSLMAGDGGRVVTGLVAAIMVLMAASGATLVARRTGGWRRWFAPLRGPLAGRLHVEIARVAVVGLSLSSLTALWMTAVTFGLLPDGQGQPPFPDAVSGQTGMPLTRMAPLADTPLSALRELTFPYAGDTTDVFTLQTGAGTGLVDQGTGALIDWQPASGWARVYDVIMMLHTGRGAAVLGLVLGLMALSLPVMTLTGALVWWSGRRGRPRLRHNAPASRAATIIVVGSEGGSTWGFAATLHKALHEAGESAHVTAMSSFLPERYVQARRVLVLAATYGDGAAPASARGFLERLAPRRGMRRLPVAVLGFGDRSFTHYCGYALQVAEAARAAGWPALMPLDTVNRQSPQDFARWGRDLGAVLGIALELAHTPVLPATRRLVLVERQDFGIEVQAPTSILRFALPDGSLWQRLSGRGFHRFLAGDLLGVVPEGATVPRFYSLASGHRDGFVEIVVRRHEGGLCSGQLMALQPGEAIDAFVRRNPDFNAGRDAAPLILIGAGTGVGPLAGFVRANARRRPMHLFFGMRDPQSDFLYGWDFARWHGEGRLSSLSTAVSRGPRRTYVQDALRGDAAEVARLIREGARVMVCGGREMAEGVASALAEILAPCGLTPEMLRAEGRYAEDVY